MWFIYRALWETLPCFNVSEKVAQMSVALNSYNRNIIKWGKTKSYDLS